MIKTHRNKRSKSQQILRKIRIPAIPLIAVVGYWAPAEAATIDTVVYTCDSCATYNDLLSYLNRWVANNNTLGYGVIPGFASDYYAIPGQTKLLVIAKQAPISFFFNYTATRVAVPMISAYYYKYTFSPLTALPATDDGAMAQDFALFKAKRATGLPTIKLPSTNPQGETMNHQFALNQELSLTNYISYVLFTAQSPLAFRTLPGLINKKYFPSISISYKGKYYVLYEGETLEVTLFDGTKVELTVTIGTNGGTPGYLTIKKVTPPPSVSSPTSLAPAPSTPPNPGNSGAQVSSLNPVTMLYDNSSLWAWMKDAAVPSKPPMPSLTIIQYDTADPTVPTSVTVYTYDSSDLY